MPDPPHQSPKKERQSSSKAGKRPPQQQNPSMSAGNEANTRNIDTQSSAQPQETLAYQPQGEAARAAPLSSSCPTSNLAPSPVKPVVLTLSTGSPQTRNTPLYGSLNLRDELFFIQSPMSMLKAVIASAPVFLRPALSPNPPKEELLAQVLKLRQQEALYAQATVTNPQESIQKLMNMGAQEIINVTANNPMQLRNWMKAACQADNTMNTRKINFDTVPADDLVITVLDCQLQAHKAAGVAALTHPAPSITPSAAQTALVASRTEIPPSSHLAHRALAVATKPPHINALPTLAGLLSAPQPSSTPQNHNAGQHFIHQDTSDEEDAARPGKKKKVLVIEPQGFTYGATTAIEQVLRNYPGKETSSNSLNVPDMKGPTILAHIIGAGSNVPTFLTQFKHWRETATGNPSQPEVEAHTLGRMIHTELMKHASPMEALANRPSLEIGLRRLYAVLFVEEAVNTGSVRDRAAAWRHIQFIMESHPQGTVMSDPITEEMTRLLNLEKRRIAAVKAMEETRARRTRNNQQRQTRA